MRPADAWRHSLFFFFFSGSDYKALNGKRLDDIKDKVFSKPHDVPTETTGGDETLDRDEARGTGGGQGEGS